MKLVDGKYVAAAEVMEGQDAVFRCLDKDYLTKLTDSGYTVDTEKGLLTISKENLTLGDNSITIQVEGYQTVRLSVRYQKVLEEVSLTGPTEGVQLGNPVTITCNAENHKDGVCDFFANVTGVTLKRPDGTTKELSKDGVESVFDEIGYTVNGNKLTLGKDLFSTAGNYSVTIRAGHGYEHEPKKVEFEIKAATPETPEPPSEGNKDVPAYESWTLISGYWGSGKLCFGAGGHNSTAVQPYLNAITAIKLGDTSLTPVNYSSLVESGKYCVDKGTDQTIYFYPADFSTTDSTTITIVADGYKDFTLVIGADGKVVTGGETDPGTGGDAQKKDVPTYTVKGKSIWYDAVELAFGGDAETQTWLEKINVTSVKINGTNVNLASSTFDSNFASKFYIRKGENPSYVYIGTALLTQEQNKIEITVDGYNTLEITVDKNGNEVK